MPLWRHLTSVCTLFGQTASIDGSVQRHMQLTGIAYRQAFT
jgi:hypothetical protein